MAKGEMRNIGANLDVVAEVAVIEFLEGNLWVEDAPAPSDRELTEYSEWTQLQVVFYCDARARVDENIEKTDEELRWLSVARRLVQRHVGTPTHVREKDLPRILKGDNDLQRGLYREMCEHRTFGGLLKMSEDYSELVADGQIALSPKAGELYSADMYKS